MADPLTSTLVIQGLFAIGAGGTGAAVVTGLLSRRKTRAEAAKTTAETGRTQAEIVGTGAKTASDQVDTAMELMREMRVDMTNLRIKIDDLERWKGAHERRMDAHIVWDEQVRTELHRAGILVGPPPPLRFEPSKEQPTE